MFTIKENLTTVNYNEKHAAPQWIVIHNTANGTSREGTAYANTQYFKNTYRWASAHYFVDDGDTVWRCVRDTDCAWHVGDAQSRNGCTNYNSVAIEVCETADGHFTEHEIQVLAWLVPQLMQKYGIDADHVCRHYDVTRKHCPMGYIDQGRWLALKERIIGGDDDMSTYAEKAYQELMNDSDPTGRGKKGNMRTRIAFMAQKQEKMQNDIDEIKKMLAKLVK